MAGFQGNRFVPRLGIPVRVVLGRSRDPVRHKSGIYQREAHRGVANAIMVSEPFSTIAAVSVLSLGRVGLSPVWRRRALAPNYPWRSTLPLSFAYRAICRSFWAGHSRRYLLGHLRVQIAISTGHDALKPRFVLNACPIQSLPRELADQIATRSATVHCRGVWRLCECLSGSRPLRLGGHSRCAPSRERKNRKARDLESAFSSAQAYCALDQ